MALSYQVGRNDTESDTSRCRWNLHELSAGRALQEEKKLRQIQQERKRKRALTVIPRSRIKKVCIVATPQALGPHTGEEKGVSNRSIALEQIVLRYSRAQNRVNV